MPNIVRSKRLVILLIWSTFTIISTCLGSYYVINSILEFLKYSTVTKIEVINEKQIPFPAIIICTYPSFDTSLEKLILISRFNEIRYNVSNLYIEEITTILV
jgi:hypothetical protein